MLFTYIRRIILKRNMEIYYMADGTHLLKSPLLLPIILYGAPLYDYFLSNLDIQSNQLKMRGITINLDTMFVNVLFSYLKNAEECQEE